MPRIPGQITAQHCGHCQGLRTALNNALLELQRLHIVEHELREKLAAAHTELVREQEATRKLRAELEAYGQ